MNTVSVIITTYYRNQYLKSAIRSVRSQSYDEIELIVVDDSGEYYSKEVVDKYTDIKCIFHDQNKGAQSARNSGLKHATGKYIQFLDDDDLLMPTKIERQVRILEQNTQIGVVYCGIRYDNKVELPNPDTKDDVLKESQMFHGSPMATSALLIRNNILANFQPLDCDSPGADDLRLNIKLALHTNYDYVREALVFKGDNGDSRGRSWGAVTGRWQILSEFEPEYNRFEPKIRRKALARTYRSQGYRYLDEKCWSSRAIISFSKALLLDPNKRVKHIFQIFASFLGRPGITFAHWLKQFK